MAFEIKNFAGKVLLTIEGDTLRGANLRGANLEGANLSAFSLVPERGFFTAYKKLDGGVIAELLIPEGASRTSSLVGRKCRASEALVVGLSGPSGKPVRKCTSTYDPEFVYQAGKTVVPDKYDPDIRIECTNGIHFFITRKEAEEY